MSLSVVHLVGIAEPFGKYRIQGTSGPQLEQVWQQLGTNITDGGWARLAWGLPVNCRAAP